MRKFCFAFTVIACFASCKKNYDCVCKTKDSSGNTIGTETYPINGTRVSAKSECDKKAQSSIPGSSTSKSCSIE